ncbi:MAG: hypothetical protein H7Y39_17570 [Nitrospiraceae bacterium]|nr:hypothetical protein [Nitrospiraceae bacterium]
MTVTAVKFIRKMRGGSQAHLLKADDGHNYVVKFRNNPQHRRILINEWIASAFLQRLQISAPAAVLVLVSQSFLLDNPEVSLILGTGRQAVEPGIHFGSRYPVDPSKAVYDFFPDRLHLLLENKDHFLGILVFDKWLANTDLRQAIFARARINTLVPAFTGHSLRVGYVAMMIDHGNVLDGRHWKFEDSSSLGLYSKLHVYDQVSGMPAFEPWVDKVHALSHIVAEEIFRTIPEEWVDGDRHLLCEVLDRLMVRKRLLPSLIEESRRAHVNLFPMWK